MCLHLDSTLVLTCFWPIKPPGLSAVFILSTVICIALPTSTCWLQGILQHPSSVKPRNCNDPKVEVEEVIINRFMHGTLHWWYITTWECLKHWCPWRGNKWSCSLPLWPHSRSSRLEGKHWGADSLRPRLLLLHLHLPRVPVTVTHPLAMEAWSPTEPLITRSERGWLRLEACKKTRADRVTVWSLAAENNAHSIPCPVLIRKTVMPEKRVVGETWDARFIKHVWL